MNKNYFKYLFENKKVAWGFFLLIYTAIAFTPFINRRDIDAFADVNYATTIMSVILAFVLPVLLFSFVHAKKSVDLYFAMPLKRSELLITTLLFSFVIAFGYFLVTNTVGYVLFMIGTADVVNLLKVIGYTGFVLAVILLVNTVFYLTANNVIDGIIMIGAYSVLPVLVYATASILSGNLIAGSPDIEGTFFGNIGMYLSPVYMGVYNIFSLIGNMGAAFEHTYSGILILYMVASGFALKKMFIERKTERADQVSDSFCSYRTVVHIYLALCALCLGSSYIREWNDFSSLAEALIFYLVLLVIYVVAMFIYQRKVQITLKIIAKYLLICAGAIAVSLGIFFTRGAGLADNYTINEGKELIYRYNSWHNIDMEASNVWFELEIPTDKIDQYKEVVETIEGVRKKEISTFYAELSSVREGESAANSDLSVMNRNERERYTNIYRYHGNDSDMLSEEDLKKISYYTDISVYDSYKGEQYTIRNGEKNVSELN